MKAMIEAIRRSSLNAVSINNVSELRPGASSWVSITTDGVKRFVVDGGRYAEFQVRLEWCVDGIHRGVTIDDGSAALAYALYVESVYGTVGGTAPDDATPEILERAVATAEEIADHASSDIVVFVVAKKTGRKTPPSVVLGQTNCVLRYTRESPEGYELCEIPIYGPAGKLYYGMARYVGAVVTDRECPSLDKNGYVELATQLAGLDNSTSRTYLDSRGAAGYMSLLSGTEQAPQGAMAVMFQNGFLELTQITGHPVKCVGPSTDGSTLFDFYAASAFRQDCSFACVDYEKTVHVFSFSRADGLWKYTQWFKESWLDLINREMVSV